MQNQGTNQSHSMAEWVRLQSALRLMTQSCLQEPTSHAPEDLATHTHTHPFSGSLSETTRVRRYQKGKTNLDFTGARDSEWQWHQLGHMQVCTSLQTDNHASTPPLSFSQARCPSCRPTNSVKALKAPSGLEDLATSNQTDFKQISFCNKRLTSLLHQL